jgi:hypothetical protein
MLGRRTPADQAKRQPTSVLGDPRKFSRFLDPLRRHAAEVTLCVERVAVLAVYR